MVIYGGQAVEAAIEVLKGLNMYQAGKMSVLFDASRYQGKKEGRAEVLEEGVRAFKQIGQKMPHRNPGQPRKKK